MKPLRSVLLIGSVFWNSALLQGQDASVAPDASGVEPKLYGSNAGSPIDNIDLMTGNLTLNIPLISFPQLGRLPPLSFSIGLNNAPYSQADGGCYSESDCVFSTSRYDTSPPGAPYPAAPVGCSSPPAYVACSAMQNLGAYLTSSFEGPLVTGTKLSGVSILYTLVDPSGGTHELDNDANSWNTYRASDGSGWTFIPADSPPWGTFAGGNAYDPLNTDQAGLGQQYGSYWLYNPIPACLYGQEPTAVHLGTIISPTGIQYSHQLVPGGEGFCNTIVDLLQSTATDPTTNSSIARSPWYWSTVPEQCQQGGCSSPTVAQTYYCPTAGGSYTPSYTDSVGRTIPDIIAIQSVLPSCLSNGTPGSYNWTVPGPNGNSLTFAINYGYAFASVPWDNDASGPTAVYPTSNFTGNGITSIVLPNQSRWTFTYGTMAQFDGTGPPTATGELSQVTLPTGGSISYTYETLPQSESAGEMRCGAQCRAIATRTESDGQGNQYTTYYVYAWVSGTDTFTTTVTDPAGNDTVHTFDALVSASGQVVAFPQYETRTDYYRGTGTSRTLLKTVQTTDEYQSDFVDDAEVAPVNLLPNQITTTTYGAFGEPTIGSTTTVAMQYSADQEQPLFSATHIICGDYGTGESRACKEVQYAALYSSSPMTTASISYAAPTRQTISYGSATATSSSSGTTLRSTSTEFLFQAPPAQGYVAANIIGLPLQTETLDGQNHVAAKTTYIYDESNYSAAGSTTGNLTTTNRWLLNTTGLSVGTHVSYDSLSRPTFVTDANGNTTKISGYMDQCSSNVHSYSQTVTQAYSSTTTVAEPTVSVYDCNTGSLTNSTDPNSVQTAYIYTSDLLGRLTQVNSGIVGSSIGSEAKLNYPSMTEVHTAVDKSTVGDGLINSSTFYDGLGRVIKQENPDTNYVCTTYNTMGQVWTVSNPVSSCPAPAGSFTTYAYDPFGRVVMETEPDGNQLWWCYNGIADPVNRPEAWENGCPSMANTNPGGVSWVDTMDEAGIVHQQVSNALGQLIAAIEPVPQSVGSGSTLGLETDYGYDALGNLISVNQLGGTTAGASARTRSYTYDSLSRLWLSSNPETGTICYGTTPSNAAPYWNGSTNCTSGYDGNGNLLYKTDARGVKTSYTYDALNRLLTKTSTDPGSPSSCYTYDNTTSGVYGIGRLSGQWTQAGSCSSTTPTGAPTSTTISAYDPMGRVISETQCVFGYCSQDYPSTPTYTYDLAGNLKTYGDGRGVALFTNSYDNAARLNTMTSSVGSMTLFSSPSFNLAGQLTGATYGTGLQLTRTYDSRLRISSEKDVGIISEYPSVPATVTITGSELSH